MNIPKSVAITVEFCIKIVAVVGGFLAIGASAIALHEFTKYVDARSTASDYFVYGLKPLEYVIFGSDILSFGYFIIVETVVFMKEITDVGKKGLGFS